MIRFRPFARVAALGCAAFVALALGGCGNGRAEVPTDDVAKTALEASLNAWKSGGKPGALPDTNPPVQVHDTPWSQGATLGSYEILGQETEGAEKRFKVRLSLTKPEQTEEVEYHVLGQGPVMVFRDQDYLRNINMEDGPKLQKAGTSSKRRRRD